MGKTISCTNISRTNETHESMRTAAAAESPRTAAAALATVARTTAVRAAAALMAILAIAACFAEPGCFIFIPIFIWGGLNRKITISLRSGNQAVVYSRSKKRMEAFVADVKAAAKIS